MVRKLKYRIDRQSEGQTIEAFLKGKGYSRAVLIELKKTRTGITKNKIWACVNETLKAGDELDICLVELESSKNIVPIQGDLNILYEDEDILVLNKPYDTPIHPSLNNYENTLANRVLHYYNAQNKNYIFRCMNRLDRDTTGATMIAKHLLSAAVLSKQVQEGTLTRTYIAFVEGITEIEGTINLPISRVNETIIKRQVDELKGKPAVTHYKRLEVIQVEGKAVSIIELNLETGRTHQIRVHLSHIGHPLIGDFLYNEGNTMLSRQALHSSSIAFYHPISGDYMKITAPLYKDMEALK